MSFLPACTRWCQWYRVAVLLILFGQVAFGQELRFRQFALDEGFVHTGTSFHQTILKDDEGFVWFSTYGGLSRFDGEAFFNCQHDPKDSFSLPVNLITAITMDREGMIWIGSVTRGVFLFDRPTESFRSFSTGDPSLDTLLTQEIHFIREDARGRIWIGGGFGVLCWDPDGERIIELPKTLIRPSSFFRAPDDQVWIGDEGALHRYIPSENRFLRYPLPISSASVVDCIRRQDGTFWVSTNNAQLLIFDPSSGTFTRQTSVVRDRTFLPSHFTRINDTEFWCWSTEGLLHVLENGQRSILYKHNPDDPLSLPNSPIADVFIDESGNLFILTYFKGIAVSNTHRHLFESITSTRAMEVLKLPDHQLLLREFDGNGVLIDTRQKKRMPRELPIGSGNIYRPSIALQEERLLWYWQPDGISVYDLESGKSRKLPSNPHHSLYVELDRNGQVWNGLSYFDAQQNKWEFMLPELQQALPELAGITYSYSPVYFDHLNRLWANIITQDGRQFLISYDRNTRAARSFPHVHAHHFFAGEEGRFYITNQSRLIRYDPFTDTLSDAGAGLTLDSGIMYGKEDSKGNLWLNSINGLYRYNPMDSSTVSFNIHDGFPTIRKPITRILEKDDQGYFYTDINMEQIVRFHPDSMEIHPENAGIRITGFFLSRQRQIPGRPGSILARMPDVKSTVGLSHDQSDFGFSFTMPLFYKSTGIEYFCRLTPYQDEWVSLGTDNTVHYSLVPPGTYVFEVKSLGANGEWSANIARARVQIFPPWYRSWWAWIIYGLILLTVLAWIRRYDLRRKLAAQKVKQLQEMTDLKTQLYTNVTHEFRTPLTVILGLVDQIREYAYETAMIKSNSFKLLRLVDQLLDLTKVDTRAMPVQMIQADVIPYLRYLTESFSSLARDKGIMLEISSSIDELVMDFDEAKLQQVVYNLISNAIKFTAPGGQISVHLQVHVSPDGDQLELTFSDTGIGIAPTDQERVFDRFYQADQTMTRKGEGTGIGLALTKELVELLGGSIHLTSQPGEGSLFTVLLPITKLADLQAYQDHIWPSFPDPVSHQEPILDDSVLHDERPRLLLIEDNPDLLMFMTSLLQGEFQIESATNGQLGIDLAISSVPDIIVSDVMMPEKNGYEVCETLKQDVRTNHIPIILLTAKVEQEDRVTGLVHGADAYLTKPFDKAELFVRLNKLLELRRVLREKYREGATQVRQQPERPDPQSQFLFDLRISVARHMAESDETLGLVQQELGLSQMQLYRKLKAIADITPTLFVRQVRLEQARELLLTTDLQIAEIAYQVGFNDPAYFSRAFSDHFGQPPSGIRSPE
ncbi:MAG: response regulator [Lewinellaceae bacterium]|nr:response regulator [Saprospiraceae bacterium]MCB9312912.1 response regulator [Lewinellaceae bacterium]HRW74308.1 ATP-binding protein [Saprospiraceae bacterium]